MKKWIRKCYASRKKPRRIKLVEPPTLEHPELAYAYYSHEMDKNCGHLFYSTVKGQRLMVTCVLSDLKDRSIYKWKDLEFVGVIHRGTFAPGDRSYNDHLYNFR